MKINFLILLSILSIVILSCDSGLKFENPNDKNSDAYNPSDTEAETDSDKTDTISENDDETDTSSENNDDDTPCTEGTFKCHGAFVSNICRDGEWQFFKECAIDEMCNDATGECENPDQEPDTPDNSDSASDNDADSDSGDSTPDEDADNQESGFDKNSQGIWVDPEPFKGNVHLIWENPMGNKGMGGVGPSHANALTYCENLVLAGVDDWRLPTIDELRTLVRGISTIEPGGKCPTTENCTDQAICNNDKENTQGFGNSCLGCEALNTDKYDPAISYLDFDNDCQLSSAQLENNECYIVKAMYGDPCNGTWSSTPNTGTNASLKQAYWYLNYKNGIILSDADMLNGAKWVRCVREGTAADVPE